MQRVLIWDLPTRVFHWLFALGFLAAALIALVLGEESAAFPYHAIIGLTLAAMLVLRLLWGLVGSRHARFRSFLFTPAQVAAYFRGVLSGKDGRYAGHNPGSAWAIGAMLVLMAGLAVTGVMLGLGNEGVKEVHEVLAYSMLGVAGVHVLGVVVHTLRHRENIAASMVHGRRRAEASEGIRSAHPIMAVVFLLISGAWLGGLLARYDAAARTTTIPLLGMSLHVGESEGVGGEDRHSGEHERDGD